MAVDPRVGPQRLAIWRAPLVDELIKLIQDKTGISEAQARQAADTVLGFVKDRLPAPLAGQIDGILGGTGSASPLAGLGDLGNLGG